MTADDDALLFLLKHKAKLFPSQPAVFFGVNDITRAREQNGRKGITGVIEAVSMEETVQMMLDFLPNTEKVLALVDTTPSSVGDLKTFRALSAEFPQLTFSELSLGDYSYAEFAEKLQKIDNRTAVLLLSAYVDREGTRMLFGDSLRLILDNLHQPLFHLWYHGMGEGIVGGKVISHEEQGKTAAELVLRILAGEPAESIKVIEKSPNVTIVDYNVLTKFGLEKTELAEDAIILNRPFSLYDRYKYYLWLGTLFIVSQTLLILFLFNVVSRNKKTELALRESDDLLSKFIEHSPAYAYIQEVTPTRCISVRASKNFEELTGIPFQQMKEKCMEEIFPKEFAAKITAEAWKVFSSGTVTEMEEEFKGRSFFTIKFPLIVGGKNLVAGYSIDITMRKNAERDLRHSYELMSYIIKHSTSALAVHDKNFNYIFVSERYLKDYKVKDRDVIGKHHYDVFPDIPAKWRDAHKKALAGKTSRAENDRYDRDDGSVEWTTWECRPWYEVSGEVGGFIVYTEVVTERIKSEEQKLLLLQQLHQAQKMEAIGTLAGGIAHDFNNILGAILGYAEMAKEDSEPGSRASGELDRVIEAGNRAAGLVKQILAFSRQTVSEPIPLNPEHIVLEVIKLLRPSLPSTIAITQQFASPINTIIADPTQIHQIVMNLCTNAFHAMEKTGGTLNIRLENRELVALDVQQYPEAKPGDYILLSISDTGPGIPPEIRNKIYDPFFTTKEVGKGTGMGLATVYGIASSLGGFITCESTLGQGATFRTFLPAVLSDAIASPTVSDDVIPVGKEHVLYVDDEETLAELGKTMLERLGYHVTRCTDSKEALSLIQEYPNQFDILVTDQTMPGMTGFDLSRKALQIRPTLPIILCTGYSNIVDEEAAKQAGIKGFIMKPLTKKALAELLAKVKNENRFESR
jgi:PAS domain S-box-containing protein